MIKKKICMLGEFSVGKTSLVRRFVESVFDEKYLTTVGVKVDRRMVEVAGKKVSLILWDISGEDSVQELRLTYTRGTAGYLLVADGTRACTLKTARDIQKRLRANLGDLPFILLVNKVDLESEWELTQADLQVLAVEGWHVLKTSAKTGQGVEEAFDDLAKRIV